MKGTVYAIDHGLAFVKLDDGGICWLEAMTGDSELGEILLGDPDVKSRRQIANETSGRPGPFVPVCIPAES